MVNTARAHGTAVLGIICAADNSLGTVGIVPNLASVRVVSHQNSTLSQALLAAVAHLVAGDTLLLEVQVELNGTGLLGPVDAYACEWELVRMATALGIVVVEAGGNGTDNGLTPALDLNSYTTLSGVQLLNRDPADRSLHDSGAIIVTAATSTEPHTRLDYAPHGRRIDCFAWGENIHTLNSDSQGATALYTPRFDGTSGAAAIIAGVALAVQGYVQTLRGTPINPLEMRDLLSDPSPGFNTPAALTETTPIGVMPNLRSIFDRLTNGVP